MSAMRPVITTTIFVFMKSKRDFTSPVNISTRWQVSLTQGLQVFLVQHRQELAS